MESDEIIEVVDKRRVHLEDVTADPVTDEQAPAGEDGPSLPPMDVYGLIRTTISLLSNGAWAWMGLTPSPFTGEMERDMVQAKVAIDSVTYLVSQIESQLDEPARREMQNVVSMLRVNYVQQLSKQ